MTMPLKRKRVKKYKMEEQIFHFLNTKKKWKVKWKTNKMDKINKINKSPDSCTHKLIHVIASINIFII